MFSVAANRSKTTVQLREICRLCLCTKTMFLSLNNSTENLRNKLHLISSSFKVSCSGKVQLHLTQWHLLTAWILNTKLMRFKAFLTVSKKMWTWYSSLLPPSCTLSYRLHNVTCQQTAAAYQSVQMFTHLKNAVTKQWIVNSWYIATYLPLCSLAYYIASVCLSNPQQGIPSTPVTASHVT